MWRWRRLGGIHRRLRGVSHHERIRGAGADLVLSYFAPDLIEWDATD